MIIIWLYMYFQFNVIIFSINIISLFIIIFSCYIIIYNNKLLYNHYIYITYYY